MMTLRFLTSSTIALINYCLLTEFKDNSKKNKILFIVIWYIIAAINMVIAHVISFEKFFLLYGVFVHIPALTMLFFVSKFKGFKLLFHFLTVVNISAIIMILGYLFTFISYNNIPIEIAGKIISYSIVLYFIVRYFRKIYTDMLNKMDKGWGILCIVPLCTYIIAYYVSVTNLNNFPYKYAFVFVVAIVAVLMIYIFIFYLFNLTEKQTKQEVQNQILSYQVEAIAQQNRNILDNERNLRIYRHDMRHTLQSVLSLIQAGDNDSAIGIIEKYNNNLKQTEIKKFCENVVINSILSYYFIKIEKENIRLEYKLDVPAELTTDEKEISIILANAIENAINACQKLEKNQERMIEIKFLSKPKAFFEISNTYTGEINLNKDGYPTSYEEEHGIGTRSILKYAKKNNAVVDYKTDNNIFKIRVFFN